MKGYDMSIIVNPSVKQYGTLIANGTQYIPFTNALELTTFVALTDVNNVYTSMIDELKAFMITMETITLSDGSAFCGLNAFKKTCDIHGNDSKRDVRITLYNGRLDDMFYCPVCGIWTKADICHIFPRSLGGIIAKDNTINTVLGCGICNKKQSNRLTELQRYELELKKLPYTIIVTR